MTQITGKATVRVDGEELLSEVGATLNVGGVEREAQMGPRGVNGYKENPVAPSVTVVVHHTADTDLVRLGRIVDATVLVETDTGQSWLMRKAFVTEPPELDAAQGTFSLSLSAHGLERV
jgi:hypothetical protein